MIRGGERRCTTNGAIVGASTGTTTMATIGTSSDWPLCCRSLNQTFRKTQMEMGLRPHISGVLPLSTKVSPPPSCLQVSPSVGVFELMLSHHEYTYRSSAPSFRSCHPVFGFWSYHQQIGSLILNDQYGVSCKLWCMSPDLTTTPG
jgi:hypothetical protein